MVSNFFALLPRGDQCVFDDEYLLTEVFDQLDEQIFTNHPDETCTSAGSGPCSAG